MLEISIRLIWINLNNHFIPSKHTGERNFHYDMCGKAPHVSVTKLPPRCCHIFTDKGNGRRTNRKKTAKKCLSGVYPVMKKVSMAMRVFAECVRSA